MKNISSHRKAFSMLELVFAIIILGIVSSIGAELIANVYENYIVQRAQHRASVKTQLALNQISNRIRYAIPGTIGRRAGKSGRFELNTGNMSSGSNAYTVLQWVGADNDSFEAITSNHNRVPGWSGFCDISASTQKTSSTPGSNLDLTNTIQQNLGRTGKFAIYFPGDNVAHYGTGTGSTITLDLNTSRVVERYKLAWSSYALVVENGDLYLYYNFPPSIGSDIGNNKALLLKNVINFKFETRGQTTRIKLCMKEKISNTDFIPACKEKAVF